VFGWGRVWAWGVPVAENRFRIFKQKCRDLIAKNYFWPETGP